MTIESALIIYDGDCTFCRNYVHLLHLRETVGNVELINARSDDSRVAGFWRQGYDLNLGMLFVYKGKLHYGSDAVYELARLSSASSWVNSLHRTIFSTKIITTVLYPLLRFARCINLVTRGKKRIDRHNLPD